MTPFLCLVILVVSLAVGIGVMLVVRRRAPGGSHFNDGDRAAGVFGVLATGFALLLGLVVVLAFTSYDDSRSGAETEAMLVRQQNETAMLMPVAKRDALSGELVCYSRTVVAQEWTRMEEGAATPAINPWGIALFRTIRTVNPTSPAEQAAYAKWLDQTSDREVARQARLHGSVGVIPGPLWFVLIASAAVIVAFMLLFADSDEPWFIQAALIGSVILVVVSSLLLIGVLDQPFSRGFGGVRPTAMAQTSKVLVEQRALVGLKAPIPCDAAGQPLATA